MSVSYRCVVCEVHSKPCSLDSVFAPDGPSGPCESCRYSGKKCIPCHYQALGVGVVTASQPVPTEVNSPEANAYRWSSERSTLAPTSTPLSSERGLAGNEEPPEQSSMAPPEKSSPSGTKRGPKDGCGVSSSALPPVRIEADLKIDRTLRKNNNIRYGPANAHLQLLQDSPFAVLTGRTRSSKQDTKALPDASARSHRSRVRTLTARDIRTQTSTLGKQTSAPRADTPPIPEINSDLPFNPSRAVQTLRHHLHEAVSTFIVRSHGDLVRDSQGSIDVEGETRKDLDDFVDRLDKRLQSAAAGTIETLLNRAE